MNLLSDRVDGRDLGLNGLSAAEFIQDRTVEQVQPGTVRVRDIAQGKRDGDL